MRAHPCKILAALTLSCLIFSACGAGSAPRPAFRAGADIEEAVAHLNALRQAAGLRAVELDEDLTSAAALHARYLDLNRVRPEAHGAGAHQEQPQLPGHTADGALAAARSVIAWDDESPRDAVDTWISTLYHRVPLLKRDLRRIGFAGVSTIHVLSVEFEPTSEPLAPVAYPHERQSDTPGAFSTGEWPDPRPPAWAGTTWADAVTLRTGFPITLIVDPRVRLEHVTASLRTGGEPVEVALSAPDAPARPDWPQDSVVALLPRRRLTPGATYDVEIDASVGGAQAHFAWSFTVVSAARLVFDECESFAGHAGPAVVTGRVSGAHVTELCDSLSPRVNCQDIIVLTLSRLAGPADAPTRLTMEVNVPASVPGARELLALSDHHVEFAGYLRIVDAQHAIVDLDELGTLREALSLLPQGAASP